MSSNLKFICQRRVAITALPLYYSGYLLKRCRAEDFKGYHAELRGATIFLYQDELQETYTEKLDLEELESIQLDSPYVRRIPVTFTLKMKREKVQLRMENPDSGEEWRCYILTVAKKEIPSKVQLLPGQVLKLQEVLTQERRRTQPLPSLPVPPRPPPLPSASPSNLLQKPTDRTESSTVFPECFFRVSRQEAEQMLEANPENGGLIMRPANIANSYAVTLRLLTPSGHVMKNYRVSSTKSGFIIRLDTPVTVSSLHDVVRYFQERTEFRLVPYSPSELYDTQIDLPTPPRDTRTTPLHPGLAPWCKVVPRRQPEAKDLPPPEAVDGGYVYPDCHITDDLKLGETPARLDQEGVWKKVIYTSADEEEQLYEN
ncbi:signal-transducing adaptor protein 1-like [Takifugu flavidus]|uniref:signal-transducing adaptor protein 1-like n=1 Tax=Takifugu flavidus TaxID=433684 RepID=UPI002544552E|nr:signal-transducing adaptor protein 1-like [Takifugu flavidus]